MPDREKHEAPVKGIGHRGIGRQRIDPHETAPHEIDRQRPSGDLRRAYEHLARIDILEGALAGPAFCDVSTLVAMALTESGAGRERTAAELLCAAEHISFAAQSPRGYASAMRVIDELRGEIDAEFDTLMQHVESFRTERTWPRHGVLPEICARTLQMAREAHGEGVFGRALELARATELLAALAADSSMPAQERLAS